VRLRAIDAGSASGFCRSSLRWRPVQRRRRRRRHDGGVFDELPVIDWPLPPRPDIQQMLGRTGGRPARIGAPPLVMRDVGAI